jgi:hypothetical protein
VNFTIEKAEYTIPTKNDSKNIEKGISKHTEIEAKEGEKGNAVSENLKNTSQGPNENDTTRVEIKVNFALPPIGSAKVVKEVTEKTTTEVAEKASMKVVETAIEEVNDKPVTKIIQKTTIEVAEKSTTKVAEKISMEVAEKSFWKLFGKGITRGAAHLIPGANVLVFGYDLYELGSWALPKILE